MELKKDLLQLERGSKFQRIYGIFVLLIVIFSVIYTSLGYEDFTIMSCIQIVTLLIMGIMFVIQGFGLSPERLLGKAYVDINEQHIALKLGVFTKEQIVYWKDIKSIDYNFNKYHIVNVKDETSTLDLSRLEFLLKKEIKSVIKQIADKKGLTHTEKDNVV
jgi:hypothetical protein